METDLDARAERVNIPAILGTIIFLGVATSPIWISLVAGHYLRKAYHFAKDFRYRNQGDVVDYPSPDDLHDLEMIKPLHPVSLVRTQVGEVELMSGRRAVYSMYSCRERYYVGVEGAHLNERKVRRFPEELHNDVVSQVTRELSLYYPNRQLGEVRCL